MNDTIGIDLSLRSTGIVHLVDQKITNYTIIDLDSSIKDEELFVRNANLVADFVEANLPKLIVIEGFSFGASSGEMDKIHANYWVMRIELWKRGITARIPIEVIPVTSWRSPLFDKAERKVLTEAGKLYKANKIPTKGLKGDERKEAMAANKILEMAASIKEATLRKLPEEVRDLFATYLVMSDRHRDQMYDLCDAYFLARHFSTK